MSSRYHRPRFEAHVTIGPGDVDPECAGEILEKLGARDAIELLTDRVAFAGPWCEVPPGRRENRRRAPRSIFCMSSRLTSPSRRTRLAFTFSTFPFAAVRDMTRLAPCLQQRRGKIEGGNACFSRSNTGAVAPIDAKVERSGSANDSRAT